MTLPWDALLQATPSTGAGTPGVGGQYNSSNVLSNPFFSTPSQGAAGGAASQVLRAAQASETLL